MTLRIYLAGSPFIEHAGVVTGEEAFTGRQARLAFAFLVLRRGAAVDREELAAELWGEELPPSWEETLSGILSRVRRVFRRAGVTAEVVGSRFGSLSVRLPGPLWVDVEQARESLDQAESGLRHEDIQLAWRGAMVAYTIARRGFLAGESSPWVEQTRNQLRDVEVRSLDILSEACLVAGECSQALMHSMSAIEVDPLRERGYEHAMQAHARLGNRAAALQIYDRCRAVLDSELGVPPSPETEAVFLEILRS